MGVEINSKRSGGRAVYSNQNGTRLLMRSTWEVSFVYYLDSINVKWFYEKEKYLIGPQKHYSPDFWIYDRYHNLTCVVDVKGYYREKSKQSIKLFQEIYPKIPILVLTGPVLKSIGVLGSNFHPKMHLVYDKPFADMVVNSYLSGESALSISKKYQKDAREISRLLKENNIHLKCGRRAKHSYSAVTGE